MTRYQKQWQLIANYVSFLSHLFIYKWHVGACKCECVRADIILQAMIRRRGGSLSFLGNLIYWSMSILSLAIKTAASANAECLGMNSWIVASITTTHFNLDNNRVRGMAPGEWRRTIWNILRNNYNHNHRNTVNRNNIDVNTNAKI